MDNPLQQAIAAIKAGDKSTGKRLLAQVLQAWWSEWASALRSGIEGET